MARTSTSVERNTFIRGLVTEAGPLTFPENASKDEENFILNKDGSRQRRLGMDYEDGFQLNTIGVYPGSSNVSFLSSYRWENVGNDSRLTIGVVQADNKLFFCDMSTTAPSANLLNGGNSITIATLVLTAFNYAAVNGVLVLVGEGLDNPVFLKYDQDTDTITQTEIVIEVRDIWGLNEALAIDERPTTLTAIHEYNLKNQGWDNTKISSFHSSQGKYPSNADIWVLGKDATDDFDPDLLVKQDLGTTLASRGRFILQAFDRGAERQAASGLTGLPQDRETGNISTAAAFAGRIFYSGIRSNITVPDDRSPSFSGTILFSPIIDNNKKFGFCYQEGDPTAEFNAELVSSDGGTIQIPEAAGIFKILALETVLLVFAENGVWMLSGGEAGFSAGEFAVRKITDVGATGHDSVVAVDGSVVYWARGGIYQLTPDPRSGRLVAQNITERTIQTRYNEIPTISKVFAKGTFDTTARQVKWLYNDDPNYDGVTRVNSYNKELVLDFVLGAFSIMGIGEISGGPYVAGYLSSSDFITSQLAETVIVGANNTVQVSAEDVIVSRDIRSRGNTTTKYLVAHKQGLLVKWTLASYSNGNFLDWEEFNSVGIDAPAFMLTGEELFSDTQRDKSVKYLTAHMLRTETGFILDGSGDLQPENPSSCLIQARWDFSNSAASGKFGDQFEAYRLTRNYIPTGVGDPFDYGQEVITTKTKLRGSGRALSIRFDTSPGKDLLLYGWGMSAEGNTVV
jgi:hypothetical protein